MEWSFRSTLTYKVAAMGGASRHPGHPNFPPWVQLRLQGLSSQNERLLERLFLNSNPDTIFCRYPDAHAPAAASSGLSRLPFPIMPVIYVVKDACDIDCPNLRFEWVFRP